MPDLPSQTIAFIGAGNMAASLIGGLLAAGWRHADIRAADPVAATRARVAEQFGIAVGDDNQVVVDAATTVVIAVKPQLAKPVLQALRPTAGQLWLSIAAGVRCADLGSWLGGDVALVRTMPNTPALLQSGATAMYANPRVDAAQRAVAEQVMSAVGSVAWLHEEALLDAATAVSGSGPAYFFLFIEAIAKAGTELGLSQEQATELAIDTALGAARMARESGETPAELRRRVTSPNGTTEQAIRYFQEQGLQALVDGALKAARDRAIAIGNELGDG